MTDITHEHSLGEAESSALDAISVKTENGYFFVKPHIQLGRCERRLRSLNLAFHVFPSKSKWRVDFKRTDKKKWHDAEVLHKSDFKVVGSVDSVRYLVKLDDLSAGCVYDYRIWRDDEVVFASSALSPKRAAQPFRFVVYGDVADGSSEAASVSHSVHATKPDMVVLAGDIVYEDGRVSEYMRSFFPVYNSDVSAADQGAPLLRSVLTVAALGNHDARWPQNTQIPVNGKSPDVLGFFHFWNQADNGPELSKSELKTFTQGRKRRKRLAWLLGKKFLRRSNFSFDYGNAHWLVLDGNKHADWSSPYLRAWVEADLKASEATWKFVVIHQPPFTHDPVYAVEQSGRNLCDIFQEHGVDVVFSGHSHAYERHHPLRFFRHDGDGADPDKVPGDFELDLSFDGVAKNRMNGVLYLVSGAGAPSETATKKPPAFLAKRVEGQRSFTVCDVSGSTLSFRQIGENGVELDRFIVSK